MSKYNEDETVHQMEKIAEGLSDNAYYVFQVATEAIMETIPVGTVSNEEILEGLRAIIKVTELQIAAGAPTDKGGH
jgi:hypothetical protein